MNVDKNGVNLFLDRLLKEVELTLRLRRSWVWGTILWLLICLTSHWMKISALLVPLVWAIFGMVAGGLITNIGNSNPIFIRSFGDAVYMLQNTWFILPKAKALDSPIFIGLFGTSFYKVIPVSEKTLTQLKGNETITLSGSSIVSIVDQMSLYLLLKNSNILYSFPDYGTLIDLNRWIEDWNKDKDEKKEYDKKIELRHTEKNPLRLDSCTEADKKYVLGPPLVSSTFWRPEIWRHSNIGAV